MNKYQRRTLDDVFRCRYCGRPLLMFGCDNPECENYNEKQSDLYFRKQYEEAGLEIPKWLLSKKEAKKMFDAKKMLKDVGEEQLKRIHEFNSSNRTESQAISYTKRSETLWRIESELKYFIQLTKYEK